MDACSLRQYQQRGRARWWRSRLRSETGGSEQGPYILCHSAFGGLTGARGVCANAEKRKSHVKSGALVMRSIALVIALVGVLIAPAFAQKTEIEAVNAKWIDFFNKGDFAGVASLYTEDATAFPPGSGMVKGRAAIETLWKSMAEQVSEPKLTTVDVKPLGASAAREIGTFSLKTKGPMPNEVTGKYLVVWEKIGNDWKLAADIWNDGK